MDSYRGCLISHAAESFKEPRGYLPGKSRAFSTSLISRPGNAIPHPIRRRTAKRNEKKPSEDLLLPIGVKTERNPSLKILIMQRFNTRHREIRKRG
ncbi:TPA: hypothetical protein EYP44_00730 [Candidatus Bathyarchaeota archaeon]|nr:hypothetical protein [Candidatus Bathyarchaeota archaeon]